MDATVESTPELTGQQLASHSVYTGLSSGSKYIASYHTNHRSLPYVLRKTLTPDSSTPRTARKLPLRYSTRMNLDGRKHLTVTRITHTHHTMILNTRNS